jgi:hypothetical protein
LPRERTRERIPGRRIASQRYFAIFEPAFEGYGRAVVERMREGDRRVDPGKAVIRQRQRREIRRAGSERIHGRTEIVEITGKRQLERSRRAAKRRLLLEDIDMEPCPREDDCGGETIGARADNARAPITG